MRFLCLFLADSGSALNLEGVPVTSVTVCTCLVVAALEVSFLRASKWEISVLVLCWGQASPPRAPGLDLVYSTQES